MLRIMLELRWTHVYKRHFPCRRYMEKREDPGEEVVATVSARSQRVANRPPPQQAPTICNLELQINNYLTIYVSFLFPVLCGLMVIGDTS